MALGLLLYSLRRSVTRRRQRPPGIYAGDPSSAEQSAMGKGTVWQGGATSRRQQVSVDGEWSADRAPPPVGAP
jgi:hypothetical protein